MMIGRAATIGPASSSAPGHTRLNHSRDEVARSDSAAAVDNTALVPQVQPLRQSASAGRRPHNDAAFITHLIATAEHAPQTRDLRRASPADAMAGYHAATSAAGSKRDGAISRLV